MTVEYGRRRPHPVLYAFGIHSFARAVAMLLATTTMLMALFTFLNVKADGNSKGSDALTQTRSLEALTLESNGKAQVSFDWGEAYRQWKELDTAAQSALEARDEAETVRLVQLRDAVRADSDLLSRRFFPRSDGLPGTLAPPDRPLYEVELYYKQVQRLGEEALNLAEIKAFWDGQVNRYITVLAFLSAALFIGGLALTVPRSVGGALAGLSIAVVICGSAYGGLAYRRSEPLLPATALDSYAEGMAAFHLAEAGTDEEQRKNDYDLAILRFSEALFFHDGYMNALTARAEAHLARGLLEFGTALEGTEMPALQAALDDYRQAQGRGLDDAVANWNLGWIYYLLGRFDDAVAADKRALALDPSQFAIRANLGLAYVAGGRFDEAEREIMAATDDAAGEILAALKAGKQPPASSWVYLEDMAADLDNLFMRMDGQDQAFNEAPSSRFVKDPASIAVVAARLRDRISNLIVALEETGKPPATTAATAGVAFKAVAGKPGGEVARTTKVPILAGGTRSIELRFDYDGMLRGQNVVWRVFRNGEQDRLLGRHRQWDLDTRGTAAFTMSYEHTSLHSFSPGYYAVELFIEQQLVGRVTFIVSSIKDD